MEMEAELDPRSPKRAMSNRRQKSLVLILAREFASNLAMPIYIADVNETLVYFNEPAERIAGRSFAETGEMPVRDWVQMLDPASENGQSLSREEMPGGHRLLRAATCALRPVHHGSRR
jgi:hypothetical protein